MKKRIQMMLVAGAVMAFATAAKAQCNLTVSKLIASPVSVSATGGYYRVSALVANNGRADVASTLRTPYIALYLNRSGVPGCSASDWMDRQPLPRLPRGGSAWITFRLVGLINGEHRLLAVADYTCAVPELREDDNHRGMALVVP